MTFKQRSKGFRCLPKGLVLVVGRRSRFCDPLNASSVRPHDQVVVSLHLLILKTSVSPLATKLRIRPRRGSGRLGQCSIPWSGGFSVVKTASNSDTLLFGGPLGLSRASVPTQRATKGFSVANKPPKVGYVIHRNPPMSLPYCLP